ncbi:hypothetical protein ACF0H5_005976 [Mactra antiquata]
MSQRSRKGVSLVTLHSCDLCGFASKNSYIFKRHKIRCKKEHSLGAVGKSDNDTIDTSIDPDTTLDDSVLNDSVDGSVDGTNKSISGNTDVEDTMETEINDDDESSLVTNSNNLTDEILPEKTSTAKQRMYQCPKCEFASKSARKFLYHQVETHNAKHNIYTCKECEYSSRFRHKVLRHMKAAHKTDVSVLQSMEPEYVGQSLQVKAKHTESKVASRPRKMVMSKSAAGGKLTVKFVRPSHNTSTGAQSNQNDSTPTTQGTGTTPESQKSESVSPTVEAAIPQNTDQLSRVVKEVVYENGEVMYKCKECTFISDDKQKVAKHAVSWHVDTKSFTCSHCDYISFDRYDFTAHRLTHRNEHQFKCDECSYSTDFRPNFDRHLSNHKGTFPHKCQHCTFGSASETVVRRHTIHNHASETPPPQPPPAKKLKLPAPKSSAATDKPHGTPTTLPAPKRKTPSPKKTASPHKTPSPHKTHEKSSSALLPGADLSDGYLYQLNSTRSFLESDCISMVPRPSLPPVNLETVGLLGREFTSSVKKLPPNITQYVEKDNGKLMCPLCDLKYKRSSDLNRHMKRKHGCKLREYLESFADSSFDKTAFTDSDFGLDEKDGTADDDNDMYSGAETDTNVSLSGETSLPNSENDASPANKEDLKCKYCDYEAKWMSDLKRHLSVHSFEKRYKCNHCPKKYKYLGDLNVHIRRDHNEEPGQVKVVKVPTLPGKKGGHFKCEHCEYTSPWKSEIDRHSRLHTEEKTFQCSSCDYRSHWRGDIRKHVYEHHPEILTEGVALNDVITRNIETAHGFVPGNLVQSQQSGVDLQSNLKESNMSRDVSPNKARYVMSHEPSPEVNMNDYVTKNMSGHSPTPSPIKELGGGIYKCQYCGFVANAPSKMDSHIATHTNLKRYMCPICGRRANWKWDIAKHIRSNHNDQVTQVIKLSKEEAESTIQSYMEANPIVRRDHHLNLTPDVPPVVPTDQFYKCSVCDFSAEKRISVARHMRYMHLTSTQSGNILVVKRNSGETSVSTSLIPPSLAPQSEYYPEEQFVDKSVLDSSLSPSSNANNTPVKMSQLVDGFHLQDPTRPFMCSTCGKRGATKGDVKKHYHYAHADQEIRIVYLGDGSQSVYAAKSEVGITDQVSKATDTQPHAPRPKTTSPFTRPSRQPKVVGYIKPFMCGLCGRRSNWRWDVSKHIRERHRGLEVQIIEMSEEEARATIQEYMDKTLPQLNKVSNSVPKKRHKKLLESSIEKYMEVVHADNKPEEINTPQPEVNVLPEPTPEVEPEPEEPETVFITNAVSGTQTEITLTDGQLKQYKCSGCAYRSNYRSDITRHIPRRHGPKAHVVFLDRETAKSTLAEYSYRRAYDRGSTSSSASDTKKKPVTMQSKPASLGPLPKEAWAGLEKKLWKCSVCSYSNEDKVDVLKHLSKHNLKAYKCTACNWTSNFRSAVQRHIQSKHPLDDSVGCKLTIKLIKEGPGVDHAGRSIMPDGNEMLGDGSAQIKPITGLESMANPQSVMSTALFYCKICNFSSSWRSCVCRHLAKIHKRKDYIALIVKKIVRTSIPIQIQDSSTPITMPSPQVAKEKHSQKDKPEGGQYIRKKNFHCKICPYKTYKGKMLKFHMSCHKPQPGIKQVKCKYCPYFVTSNRLLSQHLSLHFKDLQSPQSHITSYPETPTKNSPSKSPGVPKRHKCEKCPYMTNSKNDFLYHKQFHRPKPTADYKCEHCDYWVSHRRLIKQHMKVHEEGAYCDVSEPVVTPAKSDYSESSLIYDTVEIAAIKQRIISSKITASISQSPLVSPMKIASGCSVGGRRSFLRKDGTYRKIHQCKNCPYMNIRLRNMKLHEMMHGKRSATHVLMKCPHCDYYVGSKGLLAHHMKVHQPNYGVEFIGQEREKDRKGSQTSEDSEVDTSIPLESKVDTLLEITRFKKFGCEKCPYASSKRSRFQRHVELHGSKQKCKCDFCDYCVPTMNLLNQHMRLHFEPNQNLLAAQSILNLQYLPEMPADVALASMITNNDSKQPVSITHDHIDLYENQPDDFEPKKLYRCDRCPYANICRSNLLAHLRCHMLKNEHACPYCDYSAGKPHVLMQHVKVHFSPLPELSDWITENGGAERLKEVKNPDLKEAIEVAKLYQSEKKIAKQKEAEANGTDAKDDVAVENKEAANGEKEGKDSKKENETIDGNEEEPVKNDKELESEQSDKIKKSEKEDGAACDDLDKETTEKKDVTKADAKMEDSTDNSTYVCQYCDQDFPTSDYLVRHETKHLIGNGYEDLVNQLLKAAEIQNVKDEEMKSNGNDKAEKASSLDDDKSKDIEMPSTSGVTMETKNKPDKNDVVAMETD